MSLSETDEKLSIVSEQGLTTLPDSFEVRRRMTYLFTLKIMNTKLKYTAAAESLSQDLVKLRN